MKLSIITINFNDFKNLEKTLKCLEYQQFDDFELIIIDGGSIDGSLEVLRRFEVLPRFKDKLRWISEKDNGIYHAMNKGIKMSCGEYCFFLNAGELLADNNVFGKVFQHEHAESIIVGNVILVLDKVVRIESYNQLSFGSFYTGTICHQAAFIKRELFNKYGLYDESLKIVSDWKFFLFAIVMHNELVRYLDINICYHDLYGVSITNTDLYNSERKKVLSEFIPESILTDYENNWNDILQMRRIYNIRLMKCFFGLFSRIVNKINRMILYKLNQKLDKEYWKRLNELNH